METDIPGQLNTQMPPAAAEDHVEGHAEVWRMLLLELWDHPCSDPAVICRLLSVSKAMSALVHETCKGKLMVHIKQHQLITKSEAALTCSWLAKHAQLLQELHVDLPETADDCAEWVAAGLRAAAGVPSMQPACRTRGQSRTPAVQAIKSAEDAAAAALTSAAALGRASSTGGKQQGGANQQQNRQQQGARKKKQSAQQQAPLQMLPLLCFGMEGVAVLNTTLMRTLPAACMRLTQLLLTRPWTRCVLQSPPPGLQQLRGLRELVLECSILHGSFAWLQSFEQLTKLHLPAAAFVGLSAQHIPVSVIDLHCQVNVDQSGDLQGLTNLSSLHCSRVHDVAYLPQQLQCLTVNHVAWHEGYLQLQELRCLKLEQDFLVDFIPDIAHFSRMTQLTAFKLVVDEIMSEDGLGFSDLCAVLPRLPLVQLHVLYNTVRAGDVSLIAQCTKLTSLLLHSAYVKVDVGVIAQQLQRLQGLQELTWDRVQLRPHCRLFWGERVVLNPLVGALCTLAGRNLRSVFFRGFVLSDQQEGRLQQALGEGWDYQPEQIDSDFLIEDSSDEDGWDSDGEGGWDSDSFGWQSSDPWNGG